MTRIFIVTLLLGAFAVASAQTTGVTRRDGNSGRGGDARRESSVSQRAQNRYGANESITDADVQWMRVIYRQLDLNKAKNAPLYFPEDIIDGQENLFRIIMRLLCNGEVSAYEYLDGREVFTDEYKVKVQDLLDRFHIYYTTGKGHSEKNPRFEILESDVPTNEVLSYYMVERYEYDTRTNRMRSYVEAICPVLHRAGDFGGDAIRYPMFWVKYDDIRAHLAQQPIFVSDENNLPTCTYDDFFTLNLYDGDIYKTRNLRNQSLMQMHPDPDDLKHAQDSIQASLDSFEKKLWVPDREEVIASREKGGKDKGDKGAEAESPDLKDVVAAPATEGDAEADAAEPVAEKRTVRSTSRSDKSAKKKPASKPKASKPKASKPSSSGSSVRSVRKKR